jgi:hypothetical protein
VIYGCVALNKTTVITVGREREKEKYALLWWIGTQTRGLVNINPSTYPKFWLAGKRVARVECRWWHSIDVICRAVSWPPLCLGGRAQGTTGFCFLYPLYVRKNSRLTLILSYFLLQEVSRRRASYRLGRRCGSMSRLRRKWQNAVVLRNF